MILESYDSARGYTFSKDGVSYLTKCRTIYVDLTYKTPPITVQNQSECRALLAYLHKPIDGSQAQIDLNLSQGVIAVGTREGDMNLEVVSAK